MTKFLKIIIGVIAAMIVVFMIAKDMEGMSQGNRSQKPEARSQKPGVRI